MIAYFDESGHPSDKPVVSLSTIVAPAKNWTRFEPAWKKILRRYVVSVFHMTEYKSRQKPFDGWEEGDRVTFISTLAGILKSAIVFGATHSLVVEEWNEIVMPHLTTKYKKTRGWYIFLLQSVLEDIVRFVKLPKGESIACIFDRNSVMGRGFSEPLPLKTRLSSSHFKRLIY